MGFILLAMGRGGVFVSAEAVWNAAYLGVVLLGLKEWGLIASGLGFWLAYIVYFGVVALASLRLIDYRTGVRIWGVVLMLQFAGGSIVVLAHQSASLAYGAGVLATTVAAVYSWRRLDELVDLNSWLKSRRGV